MTSPYLISAAQRANSIPHKTRASAPSIEEQDNLAAAKGIRIALMLALPFWAVIAVLAWEIVK